VFHLVSGAARSQWQNKERAIEKFVGLMRDALKPRTRRKKTRPSKTSRERRLLSKKRRGETKRLRKNPEA
jgi:ribosome-associated protein